MATLEERIKRLEEVLAIREAFLGVKFTFPKGTPEFAKKEVTEALKNKCADLAEGVESDTVEAPKSFPFNDKEVDILRRMANKVLSGNIAKPAPTRPKNLTEIIKSENEKAKSEKPLEAMLLTTDSLKRDLRPKISSNSTVSIVKMDDNMASCVYESKNSKGEILDVVRFAVPLEDLQFNQQKGE